MDNLQTRLTVNHPDVCQLHRWPKSRFNRFWKAMREIQACVDETNAAREAAELRRQGQAEKKSVTK